MVAVFDFSAGAKADIRVLYIYRDWKKLLLSCFQKKEIVEFKEEKKERNKKRVIDGKLGVKGEARAPTEKLLYLSLLFQDT